MKKKLFALLLLAVLLLPMAVSAGVSASLNQKMATRSGPGTKYTEELGTLPMGTSITVIAEIETNGTPWCMVEFRDNGKLYRAYTGKKRIDVYGSIPQESGIYTEDKTTASVKPLYGPGEQYASRRRSVDKNATVRVFGVEGEWALCEYREDNQWARGYIHVDQLASTVAVMPTPSPVPTAAPTPRTAFNIIDREQKLCVDYYGNIASYAGHDEDFALMIGMIPVMSYFDGVPCIKHTDVYSGPGYNYWRRYNGGAGYAYTGILDTNLRIYGQENGWILIRYPSDANKGYRYGWVVPTAISPANQNRTPAVDFAYLKAVTTRYVDATDDPDRSIQYGGTSVSDHITVTALAFLDEDRVWMYCEYTYREGGSSYIARGFLPADGLRLE